MSKDIYKDVVISSRARIARNFSNMPFPTRLRPNDPRIEENLQALYAFASKKYEGIKFYQMSKLSEVDKQALLEKHLISHNLIENDSSGALLIAKDNNLSIMLNEEDHIRAQCLLKGYRLADAYAIIKEFDKDLCANCNIAFDANYGYLTSCPTNLGTGMRASVMLFLPALTLTGKLESLAKTIQTAGLTVRGAYGEGSKSVGYMYQISNQKTLGLSCEEILERVEIVINNICESEDNARKSLYKSLGVELEDKIMRALGSLTFARKMKSDEFMQNISMVKLGVSLEIIEYDIDKINNLIELAQPANLCCYNNKVLSDNERDISRATLIRETLIK